MKYKPKRHSIPPIRKHRRAAIAGFAGVVILSVLLAVLIGQTCAQDAPASLEDQQAKTVSPEYVAPTPEPTPLVWVQYPVPLSGEMQRYIYDLCAEKNIDPALVLGIIYKETGGTWNPMSVGSEGEIGLMQIHPKWNEDRIDRLGVTNLFDPRDNILVGVDLLVDLMGYGEPTEWVVMAYNGGPNYAYQMMQLEALSSYARIVLEMQEYYEESAMVVTS